MTNKKNYDILIHYILLLESNIKILKVLKFVTHSYKTIKIALNFGWRPGARYTNLRDIKLFDFIGEGFLDIDWKNYKFDNHLEATKKYRPKLTIARDVERIEDLDQILHEAKELAKYSEIVAIVPKDIKMRGQINDLIPKEFILGYSVPTRYGGTQIPINDFDRPVHLLGVRPDVQRRLADNLNVISFDCNRFTLDATFGDYFDGDIFRPHPIGGYERCLFDSIANITKLWENYII